MAERVHQHFRQNLGRWNLASRYLRGGNRWRVWLVSQIGLCSNNYECSIRTVVANFGHPSPTNAFVGFGGINSEADKENIRVWVIPETQSFERFFTWNLEKMKGVAVCYSYRKQSIPSQLNLNDAVTLTEKYQITLLTGAFNANRRIFRSLIQPIMLVLKHGENLQTTLGLTNAEMVSNPKFSIILTQDIQDEQSLKKVVSFYPRQQPF